jgi:hypothetical protein
MDIGKGNFHMFVLWYINTCYTCQGLLPPKSFFYAHYKSADQPMPDKFNRIWAPTNVVMSLLQSRQSCNELPLLLLMLLDLAGYPHNTVPFKYLAVTAKLFHRSPHFHKIT